MMRKILAVLGLAMTMAARADAQVCTNANASKWLQRGYCKLGNVDIRLNNAVHDVYAFDPFISILTGPGYIDLTLTGARINGTDGGPSIHSFFYWDVTYPLYIETLTIQQFVGGMTPMPDWLPYSWDTSITQAEIFGTHYSATAGFYPGNGPQTVPVINSGYGYNLGVPGNHFVMGIWMQQGLDNSTGTQYATTNWIDSMTFRVTMGPGTPTNRRLGRWYLPAVLSHRSQCAAVGVVVFAPRRSNPVN